MKKIIYSITLIGLLSSFNSVNAALPDTIYCYSHTTLLGTVLDLEFNAYESCDGLFQAHIDASPDGRHSYGGRQFTGATRRSAIAPDSKPQSNIFNKITHVIDPSCFGGNHHPL